MKYFTKSDKNWIKGYIANSEKEDFEKWLISKLNEQKRLSWKKFDHYRKNGMRDLATLLSAKMQVIDEMFSWIDRYNKF